MLFYLPKQDIPISIRIDDDSTSSMNGTSPMPASRPAIIALSR